MNRGCTYCLFKVYHEYRYYNRSNIVSIDQSWNEIKSEIILVESEFEYEYTQYDLFIINTGSYDVVGWICGKYHAYKNFFKMVRAILIVC